MPVEPRRDRLRPLLVLLVIGFVLRVAVAQATQGPPGQPVLRDPSTGWMKIQHTPPGDLRLFLRAAVLLEAGYNPYFWDETYATYPPLWMFIARRALEVSLTTGLPFDAVFKGLNTIADLATTTLIYLAVLSAWRSRRRATIAAALLALNPVSILISCVHASNDPVILCSIVAAYFLLLRRWRLLAYLSLGIGIAIKGYPVLVVPFFFLADPAPWRVKLKTVWIVPVPLLASLIGFVGDLGPVVKQVASYGGVTDFGYLSLARTWLILDEIPMRNAPDMFPVALPFGKVVYLIAYAGLLYARRWFGLERSLLLVHLVFLSLYGGIGAQYHLWVIPLALLPAAGTRPWLVGAYSVVAFVAIAWFYGIFHPGMFSGTAESRDRLPPWELWIHMFLNLVLWLGILGWTLQVLIKPGRGASPEGYPDGAGWPGPGRGPGDTSGSPPSEPASPFAQG